MTATLAVDHYMYTYDVSCYKNKKDGKLCDLYLGELRNQSKDPGICSDCILGVFSIQLSSPVGYSEDLASQFSSAKAKCSATSYTFTRSTYPFFAATTSPSSMPTGTTPTANSSCPRVYTVRRGDTCNSIALAQRTSTYGIIEANGMNLFCSNLQKAGPRICLPQAQCTPYTINLADTCQSIASKWNVSVQEIMAWNPFFSNGCQNIDTWRDFVICVGYVIPP